MTSYAVFSSVRLRLLTEIWPPPRLTESSLPILFIHGPTRFVNSLPRRLSIVLRTRTIGLKGDHFSKGIISYDSWGIRLHTINLNTLYRKGTTLYGERLFRDTG